MNVLFNKFSASEACLSEEQLRLYVQGKLSPFEQHSVEGHLLECELCSDALEGLRLNSNPEKLQEIVAELNQKIDNRVSKNTSKIIPFFSGYRIAAILTLVALSTASLFYFTRETNKQENSIAEKQTTIPTVSQNNFELKPTEPVSTTKEKKESLTEIEQVPSPVITEAAKPLSDKKTAKDYSTNVDAALSVNAETVSVAEEPPSVFENEEQKNIDGLKGQSETMSSVTKTESNDNDKTPRINASSKSKRDNNGDLMKEAKRLIDEKKYEQAILILNQLVSSSDLKVAEEAMWNNAIVYQNINRNDEAKELLQKIVIMNGKFKNKAEQKLK